MTTVKALSQWATDVQERDGKLHIKLHRDLDIEGVRTMLSQRDLSLVAGLRIPGTVGRAGLRAIVTAPGLPNLASIALAGFTDADAAVDEVLDSPVAERLLVLKVWGVSDALDARLGRGKAKALRQLDIRSSQDLKSLDRYFQSPHVASLRFLTVEKSGLADATELFGNRAASELRSLSLVDCDFDSDSVDLLVSSKHTQGLRKLDLSNNTQDDVVASLEALLRSGKLSQLRSLALRSNEIEDIDWVRVSFPKLRVLDLRNNPIEFQECGEVLRAPGLRSLEKLMVTLPGAGLPVRLDPRLVVKKRKKPRRGLSFEP